MDIMKETLAASDYVIRCQQYLHENPELSDQEENTVAFILQELFQKGIEACNVPKGGVLGFIKGGKPGKTVLLRADIDALPLQEDPKNDKQPKACVSKNDGVAHACGHDAHTAMLLGAAGILQEHREELEGDVVLFFERGEEHGMGDYYMMQYIQTHNIHVDGAWGLHMRPGLPTGVIGLRAGGINAGSCGWGVRLKKMEGNPYSMADCAIGIINNLQGARMRAISPFENISVAVCKFQLDEELCALSGCCRFNERERVGRPMNGVLRSILENTCKAYGYRPEKINVAGPTRNIVNHPVCYDIAKEAVIAAIGQDHVAEGELGLGGESFSTLTTYYPGIMGHVGNYNAEKGMTANIHNSHFEVDPDALKYGVAATVAFAQGFLAYKEEIPFTPFTGTIDEYYATNK